MEYNGFRYYFKMKRNDTSYYACASCGTVKCTGRATVYKDGRVKETGGDHSCLIPTRLATREPTTPPYAVNLPPTLTVVVEETKRMMEEKCIEKLNLTPTRVWKRERAELVCQCGDHVTLHFMSKKSAVDDIYRARCEMTGVTFTEHKKWTHSGLSPTQTVETFYTHTKDGKLRRTVGLAHPDLL